MRINAYLTIADQKGEKVVRCTKCGYEFGPATEDYKAHAIYREAPLWEAGFQVDPYHQSRKFLLRQFCCPGCYRLLESEVVLKGEPLS
jgi:acetone carboxylase gamma subunit